MKTSYETFFQTQQNTHTYAEKKVIKTAFLLGNNMNLTHYNSHNNYFARFWPT